MPLDQSPTSASGYPRFQIAKALHTAINHTDLETRERAGRKIERWLSVIGGIESGEIRIGSRAPVEGTPVWATLEVVTGGFATGGLLAAGDLDDHEREILTRIAPDSAEEDARAILNAYFLTESGVIELQSMLQRGNYRVSVPEEGALLLVAWLLDEGHIEQAREVLAEIGSYFDQLRFYPEPTDTSQQALGSQVHLETVGQVRQRIGRMEDKVEILKQREAIGIWTPLYDSFISLFLDTVEGDAPTIEPGDTECFTVQGGWPCREYPGDWVARAQAALDEYASLRKKHSWCKKPERKKGYFSQLRELAGRCCDSPDTLTGRDVAKIRLILAGWVTRRGLPDSDTHRLNREAQIGHATAPTFRKIGEAVMQLRLEKYPQKAGIDDLAELVAPVSEDEARKTNIAAGQAIPLSVRKRVERALSGAVGDLVERGLITSGDTLAILLPQVSTGLRAGGIKDHRLRQLFAAVYRAFRKRRSLLLVDLQHQVQIEELPWVAAMEKFRETDLATAEISRRTFEEVATLALTSFPQAILPNKLLQEMRALAKGAGTEMILVDEIAADIFMGKFSPKFADAAEVAGSLLGDSIYSRYYDIDFTKIASTPVKRGLFRKIKAGSENAFGKLCANRAGVSLGGWDTISNGMILEQQQILTTQNLASVFVALNLHDTLSGQLDAMAFRCLDWICDRHLMKVDDSHAKLIMVKNTAYAWRQMVFYISLAPDPKSLTRAVITRAGKRVVAKNPALYHRLEPAFAGLKTAMKGEIAAPQQQFLGWTKGPHPFLAAY